MNIKRDYFVVHWDSLDRQYNVTSQLLREEARRFARTKSEDRFEIGERDVYVVKVAETFKPRRRNAKPLR